MLFCLSKCLGRDLERECERDGYRKSRDVFEGYYSFDYNNER